MLLLSVFTSERVGAFVEELYREYAADMYCAAYFTLENAQDAEDAMQEVFADIAEKHVDTVMALSGSYRRRYMLNAARNTALSIKRKRSRTVSLEEMSGRGFVPPVSDADFTERLCAECDERAVREALKRLAPIYKTTLYYRYGEGLSAKEIALRMNEKPATVKQRLLRGKALLAEELKKPGAYGYDD